VTASRRRRHLAAIETFVVERLSPRLNPRRVLVSPIHAACDVLGYVRCGDGRLRLRRRGVRKFWRRLPVLQARLDAGEIDGSRVRASIASWLGYANHADAFRLSRAILSQRDVRNVGKRLLVQAIDRARAKVRSRRPRASRRDGPGRRRIGAAHPVPLTEPMRVCRPRRGRPCAGRLHSAYMPILRQAGDRRNYLI